ncbi:MAG: hypothetical protein JSW39_11720 [Desulfobacterales bacterium]|nr:MAG: hypothetical protein JSW39_11720 [Desulfobacterales bacterium]
MHQLWKNLLVAQAVYLLSEAKRKREERGAANLKSILNILEKSKLDDIDVKSIRQALKKREAYETKGIDLTTNEVDEWKRFIKMENP